MSTLNLSYELSTKDFAKALAFHLENKLWMWVAICSLDFVSVLLGVLLFSKLMLVGWQWTDGLRLSSILVWWLLLRRRFIRWILSWQLQRRHTGPQAWSLDFGPNGLSWQERQHSKAQSPEVIPWRYFKKVWLFNNGYLLPTYGARCFWIPLSLLSTEHKTQFNELLKSKKVKLYTIAKAL